MHTEQHSQDSGGLENLQTPKKGINLVHFVADYGPGDMAVTEVMDALYDELPQNFATQFTSVHSFKTTETGFVVGQLGLKPRPEDAPRRILYVNCAPRRDMHESRKNNEGEGLVYGKLSNGVEVVAVNSKFSLSLLRDHFVELYDLKISKEGSQFRSRDNFPIAVGRVAQGGSIQDILGKKLDPIKVIPSFDEGYVGYIDSFGNMKTPDRSDSGLIQAIKARQAKLPKDTPLAVMVHCNGDHHRALVATGSFEVPEGGIAFAPGSSGWDNRFWEVFMRGHNAASIFKNPSVGAEIRIEF